MLSKEIFWILALAVCTSYFAVAPVKTLATHQDGFGDQTEDSKQAIGHDANYGLYDPELVCANPHAVDKSKYNFDC